jgi:hypothetical protein
VDGVSQAVSTELPAFTISSVPSMHVLKLIVSCNKELTCTLKGGRGQKGERMKGRIVFVRICERVSV